MASTARVATSMAVTGTSYGGGFTSTMGLSTLATGTVNVDTGLNTVEMMVCTGVSGTNTEGVVFTIMEDLPCAGDAVTVDGTKVDEGAATANASTQQFCWIAFGR